MMTVRRVWPLPGWWYVSLVIGFAFAIVLIVVNPTFPAQVTQTFAKQIRPDAWAVAIGLIILGVVIAHVAGALTRYMLATLLRLTGDTTPADAWSPAVVGLCEGVLYPLSLAIGKGEFIGVWLAIKVAGQWARWSGDPVDGTTFDLDALNQGRRRFNAFLVGNALSIMFGVLVWLALKVFAATRAA
jgi:hypothetical protein